VGARRRSPGLFKGFWFDTNGRKLERATRAELAAAYRLVARHADIRKGIAR
jgi:hypothetical protein